MTDVDETEMASPPVPSKLPGGFSVERTTVEVIGMCGDCLARVQAKEKRAGVR